MIEHEPIKIKFIIDTPVSGERIEDNIINKPITINDNCIGYISDAHVHGLSCDCEGVIFNQYLGIEYFRHLQDNTVEIMSVSLDTK